MNGLKISGYASLLMVGVFFGISGPLAKYLSPWTNAYQAVALRFGIALLFAIVTSFFTKTESKGKSNLKFIDTTLFAVSFPLSTIFFTLAVFNTKISLAIFSFYIANLVSSFIFGRIFFKEKVDKQKSISLVLILISLGFFTNITTNFNIDLGFVYGLISGILQTITSIFQKRLIGINRLSLVKIQTFTGLIFAMIFMYFTSSLNLPILPVEGIIAALIYGLLFLIISYLLLIGFQKTDINIGSMLVSTELFFGPVFAYLIFRETLNTSEIIGSILVIFAVINLNLKRSIL